MKKEKKQLKFIMSILRVTTCLLVTILSLLSFLVLFTIIWLIRNWANLSASEIVFHMSQSLEGTNPDMIVDYIIKCVGPLLVIFTVLVFLFVKANRKHILKIYFLIVFLGSCGVIALSSYLLEKNTGLLSYYKNRIVATNSSGEDFIAENYVDPIDVNIVFPEKKRNLIFIYLESMESTFTDYQHGGGFDEDIIPELTSLSSEGESFSGADNKLEGGVSLSGSDWTMGGMFAQSSGLPLQLPVGGNGMENADEFFPSLITLGDILNENGYKQELMIGSEARFGGRDKYYSQHGDYALLDYNWAIQSGKIPADYHVWWGYEDSKLFEYAKEELNNLSNNDQPFNLTILTADTHFEDGYVCDLCGEKFGDNQYANVYACSSKQVYEFVEWVKVQPFYDNTTIILSGDHLTMDNDFCSEVSEDYQRHTYVCFLNSDAEIESNADRQYSTMDLFPTTIASLGAKIEGNRLGLGTNLYSSEETLLEKYGKDELNSYLEKPSYYMTNLSRIKISTDDMEEIKNGNFIIDISEDGCLNMSLYSIHTINYNSLEKAELEVERISTGEKKTYEMSIEKRKNDPNDFYVTCNTDLKDEEKTDVICKVYFTVPGLSHYQVYEWRESEE